MAKKSYMWAEQPVVISAMRKAFRRYPPYKTVRDRCKVEWYKTCKNGNKSRRVNFCCETCRAEVPAKEFKVDHTEPVVDPKEGFVDYNTYAKRLFCPIANLSGMCNTCHNAKSKHEAKVRALTRRSRR